MQSKYPVDVLFIACLLVTEMRKPVQLGTACGMATDRHKIDRRLIFYWSANKISYSSLSVNCNGDGP